MGKLCKLCGKLKSETEFYHNRKGLHSTCKPCYIVRNQRYQKTYRDKNRFAIRLRSCRARAKDKSLPFDLTEPYLKGIWTGVCPVFDIELNINSLKNEVGCAELDRIIPELGYVQGNVCWLSQRANRIKDNATLKEIERLAQWLRSKQSM